MRTTIDIQDELLHRAKAAASAQRRRLSDLVNDALHEILDRESRDGLAESVPYRVIAFGEGGPCAGVDFSDNGSLQDAMDDDARESDTGDLDFSKLR